MKLVKMLQNHQSKNQLKAKMVIIMRFIKDLKIFNLLLITAANSNDNSDESNPRDNATKSPAQKPSAAPCDDGGI